MCPVTLTVWFVCKSCNLYFAKVDDFIEHKKENHFTEFQAQNTRCIVFEERTEVDFDIESSNVETKPIILKDELQLAIDSGDVTNTNPNTVSCFDDQKLTWQIAEEACQTNHYYCGDSEPNVVDILPPKPELDTDESQSQEEINSAAPFKTQHNPYVLLKRLTSKEIQDVSPAKDFHNILVNDGTIVGRFQYQSSFAVDRTGAGNENSENYKFKCQLCQNTFPISSLKHHLKTHRKNEEQVNPHKCHVCERRFRLKWMLNKHLLTHADFKPFKCFQLNCDKSFKSSTQLRTHLMTNHSNSQPFKCPNLNCGKFFKTKPSLHAHMKCHSNVRPFPCPNCDKAFQGRYHLKEHLRTHTRERPYKCTINNCNKTFAKSGNFNAHKIQVHRIREAKIA